MVVNWVASAYGKDKAALNGWVRGGLLEYVKSKNPDWLRSQGIQSPKGRTFQQGSNDNVLTPDDIVNNDLLFSRTKNTKDKSDIRRPQASRQASRHAHR